MSGLCIVSQSSWGDPLGALLFNFHGPHYFWMIVWKEQSRWQGKIYYAFRDEAWSDLHEEEYQCDCSECRKNTRSKAHVAFDPFFNQWIVFGISSHSIGFCSIMCCFRSWQARNTEILGNSHSALLPLLYDSPTGYRGRILNRWMMNDEWYRFSINLPFNFLNITWAHVFYSFSG